MTDLPIEELNSMLEMVTAMGITTATDKDFDIEEHRKIYEAFSPHYHNPVARKVLNITCMGHKVPQELLQEAHNEIHGEN